MITARSYTPPALRGLSTVLASLLVTILLLSSLTACTATDVVAQQAGTSFDALASKLGPAVTTDPQAVTITSPGGEKITLQIAQAAFSLDLDATPFLAAGLRPEAFVAPPDSTTTIADGRLHLAFQWPAPASPLPVPADIQQASGIVRHRLAEYRPRFGYHDALDHIGIELGSGFMVEWARDLTSNDKDLVIVLDPTFFIAAGLDPDQVQGWVYAAIKAKNAKGQEVQVWKLLKPYNLP